MKKMAFVNYSDLKLLTSGTHSFNCVQHCLHHILNDLIPRIELDDNDSDSSQHENNKYQGLKK
jgi:hypothetical protein